VRLSELDYNLIKQASTGTQGVAAHAAEPLEMSRTILVKNRCNFGHDAQLRRQGLGDSAPLNS